MAQDASDYRVRPDDFSDAGNAEVFAATWKGLVAYCDALGWLYFDGRRWVPNDHKALETATKLAGWMLEDARLEYAFAVRHEAEAKLAASEDESAKDVLKQAQREVKDAAAYLAHAQKTRGVARVKGMMELAKPALIVKAARLDSDPYQLNTPDGIVDLRTGQLKRHGIDSPFQWCTRMTQAAPLDMDSQADLEGYKMWYDFLEVIACNDHSLAGFLQMMAGMALIGKVYHEGILIANGCGRNGKSTFFNALAGVLGDYAGYIDSNVLTTDRQNRGAALATLRGKRLVIAPELEEHQRLSTSTLKKLASTDKLTIEEKYRSPEDIEQTHTLVLFTNHLPRVGSTDSGTWRRLKVIPFMAVIPEDKSIQNYADVLVEKAGPAILSWAIEGAMNFIRNDHKLTIPDSVDEATEEYRAQEDWLENFIGARCIKEPGSKAGARDLYLAYKDWASENGEYVRRENDFAAALLAAGYQKTTPKNRKTWHGLRLAQGFGSAGNCWNATG